MHEDTCIYVTPISCIMYIYMMTHNCLKLATFQVVISCKLQRVLARVLSGRVSGRLRNNYVKGFAGCLEMGRKLWLFQIHG